jgi:hypothetical protein
MTIEAIIPLKDGTYQVTKNEYGDLQLSTSLHYGQGYWVSDDTGVTIEGHLTENGIKDALWLMNVQPNETIGVWTDEGITYIDRSYFFYGLNTAIDFGNLYNQKAIWDNAKGEAITL